MRGCGFGLRRFEKGPPERRICHMLMRRTSLTEVSRYFDDWPGMLEEGCSPLAAME